MSESFSERPLLFPTVIAFVRAKKKSPLIIGIVNLSEAENSNFIILIDQMIIGISLSSSSFDTHNSYLIKTAAQTFFV